MKLDTATRSFLESLFPGDAAAFSDEATYIYGSDASRRFAPPLAVVRPERTEQVVELLRFAKKASLPIYPRGRATNTVGACVPERPGLVVSTARLARILEISPDDFLAVCQPGVVNADLDAAAAKHGLFYPPDPASRGFSTVGGNASTCAGGMRAVKYGVTRDAVLGLAAVLPGGEVIRAGGRTHKNVVGLDLTRLLVGSEGTLAFIVELTLKLLPRPAAAASLAAGYPCLDAALAAAKNVFASGILPTAMEFLDRTALSALAAHGPVPWPEATGALLLVKVDGSPEAARADAARLETALLAPGPGYFAKAETPAEEAPLWELRSLLNPASFCLGPDKISDDVTVPRGAVGQAVAGITDIGRQARLPVLVFGHLGDGNLHVNVMHRADDPDQRARALSAREHIIGLTLSLRGALSGEHGVGLAKLPFLDRQLAPAERALMARIKTAFDPTGIMNPGKAY